MAKYRVVKKVGETKQSLCQLLETLPPNIFRDCIWKIKKASSGNCFHEEAEVQANNETESLNSIWICWLTCCERRLQKSHCLMSVLVH